MRRNKKQERLLRLCGELHEDDNIDPRIYFRHKSNKNHPRRTAQVCRQVERVVGVLLLEAGGSELPEIWVHSVEPAPDSSRLLIVLYVQDSGCLELSGQIHDWLASRKVAMREEVAHVLQRKRVPFLTFQLLFGGESE